MKAEIGNITRKFFAPDTSTKKSLNSRSSSYKIPMSSCKAYIEISPGESILEEDYEDLKLAIELITAQIKALNAWMSCR